MSKWLKDNAVSIFISAVGAVTWMVGTAWYAGQLKANQENYNSKIAVIEAKFSDAEKNGTQYAQSTRMLVNAHTAELAETKVKVETAAAAVSDLKTSMAVANEKLTYIAEAMKELVKRKAEQNGNRSPQ